MLELIDISFKRDNKQILDKINLKLDENKFYVITGPNPSFTVKNLKKFIFC